MMAAASTRLRLAGVCQRLTVDICVPPVVGRIHRSDVHTNDVLNRCKWTDGPP